MGKEKIKMFGKMYKIRKGSAADVVINWVMPTLGGLLFVAEFYLLYIILWVFMGV